MRPRSGMPPYPGPGKGRRDEIRVSRADLLTVARNVRRVYEDAHLLADEGIVDFDALDLSPALGILRGLVRDLPQ